VESTLQFSAILVCTFGIMFEAEYLNGAQKGTLEMSTCLVIFGSMIYYFIVAWCEVVGGLVPQLRCAFLSGQVNADEENEDDDDEPDDAEFEMFENQMTKNDSENPMKRDMGPKLLSVGEQVKLQQDVAQAVDKKRGLQKQLKALNTQQLQRGAKVKKAKKKDIGGFDTSFKSGLGSNSNADMDTEGLHARMGVDGMVEMQELDLSDGSYAHHNAMATQVSPSPGDHGDLL